MGDLGCLTVSARTGGKVQLETRRMIGTARRAVVKRKDDCDDDISYSTVRALKLGVGLTAALRGHRIPGEAAHGLRQVA